MNNPLRTPEDYELFVYTLADSFPSVRASTLTFIRPGASLARTVGEIHFDHDIRLVVRERIVYHRLPAVIDWYGYKVWQGKKSYTGTILSRTPMTRHSKALTLITNTSRPISSTIGFLRRR